LLTGLSEPGQGTHEAVQAILVDETEQQALVVIAEGPNDSIVGRPIEREHARRGHAVCVEAAFGRFAVGWRVVVGSPVLEIRVIRGDAVSGRGASQSST
jgi:hypothetical protein